MTKTLSTSATDEEAGAALLNVLITRCSVNIRKNLDGTFTCIISQSNNYRRTKNSTVSIRGFRLAGVLELAAKQLHEKREALETIL